MAKHSRAVKQSALPDLSHLPDWALVREHVVEMLTGLSTTERYRRAARGEFPPTVRLGPNTVGRRVGELRRWAADPEAYRAEEGAPA